MRHRHSPPCRVTRPASWHYPGDAMALSGDQRGAIFRQILEDLTG